MKSLPVVKDFNVIKHIPLYILYCSILPPIKILFFQTGKETFHRTAPIGISRFAHAAHDLVLRQHGLIAVAAVPASSVTVKDRGLIFPFPVKRISQSPADEFIDLPLPRTPKHFAGHDHSRQTEMRKIKHPYEKGVKARKGIEF